MPSPLPPLALALLAVLTVAVAVAIRAHARRMEALARGACMSNNPQAVQATVRRVRRGLRRNVRYGVPAVTAGLALLALQAALRLAELTRML